jgi:Flp pilus assembly pilin Flp
MDALVRMLRDDESAATMVEYAIMVAFIAAVCIAIVAALGNASKGQFSTVNSAF